MIIISWTSDLKKSVLFFDRGSNTAQNLSSNLNKNEKSDYMRIVIYQKSFVNEKIDSFPQNFKGFR